MYYVWVTMLKPLQVPYLFFIRNFIFLNPNYESATILHTLVVKSKY